jgi:hypothetical protein
MDLDKLIADMEAQKVTTKTASENAAPSTDTRLQEALATALEKTAAVAPAPVSADDPVMNLMKMATQLAGAEKESELAHANLCGQAFVDGMLAKAAMYDAQVKTAMAQQTLPPVAYYSENATTLKTAAEQGYNDALLKVAAEQGYADAQQKIAEAQFEDGFNTQVKEIHDLACGEFMKGAAETEVLLNAIRAQQ